MRTRSPRPRAFTLVELIVALTILAVVAVLASGVIWQGVTACRDGATAPQVHAELSGALERITRELRAIPQRAGAPSAVPDISSITPTSISWSTGSSLSLSGTDLLLAIGGGAPCVLLRDVTALSIGGLDQEAHALAATLTGSECDPVQRVSVSITQAREGISDSLQVTVFIRSLMQGASP